MKSLSTRRGKSEEVSIMWTKKVGEPCEGRRPESTDSSEG